MLNIVMIGCGAIGAGVLELLENDPQLRVDAVIVPRDSETQVRHRLASLRRPPRVLSALPAGERPDLLVECAGHRAIEQHVLPALAQGIPCLVVSVGALSEPGLVERLEVAAQAGGSRIELLPGAIGAIDALSAARVGGLESVRYTGRKPASAWLGTPGETVCDLQRLEKARVIFDGSAREAARLYPKNANVAATLSLAGLGLDRTQVRLIADPESCENVHQVEASALRRLRTDLAWQTAGGQPEDIGADRVQRGPSVGQPRPRDFDLGTTTVIDLNPIQPICIAGEWRAGGGDLYESLYPATGEAVARLHAASLEDVEEAMAGAHRAFRESGWAQRKPHERATVLYRIAALIRERSEELAQLQRLDNGKPIRETRNLVASAAATFQFFAAACETLEESITPSRGDFVSMSVYEPMGVVVAITPWNSPIASEAQKLAPALAAGNAVVVKPAEFTRWPPWRWRASAMRPACRVGWSACCRARAR